MVYSPYFYAVIEYCDTCVVSNNINVFLFTDNLKMHRLHISKLPVHKYAMSPEILQPFLHAL